MSKYIISKPNEVNTKSPIILGGKIDLFEITSTDPDINNFISIDENTGILTFSGLNSPIVSTITIEGSNETNSWVETMWVLSAGDNIKTPPTADPPAFLVKRSQPPGRKQD